MTDGVELTEDQKKWFGDRMSETASGRVVVSSYAYRKFRKVTDLEFLTNDQIKSYLITNAYLIP